MVHRFCAICGESIDEKAPHFGMCLECYLKEQPLFQIQDKFTFRTCLDCGSYAIKEEWIEPEENEIFSIIEASVFRFVLKTLSKKNNIDFSFSFNEESLMYSSKDLLISLELTIDGKSNVNQKFSSLQLMTVNINYEYCKNCTNLRGGSYFLSIIQLRVKDDDQFYLIKEVMEYIYKHVEKKFEKDPRQYITKSVDEKLGVDLYLSTNELMNFVIKILRGNYYFMLKRTKKLVGRDNQKGRNIYRLKSLIKFLPFRRNDTLIIDDDEYIAENITRNKIVLRGEKGTKLIKDYSYFFKKNIKLKNTHEVD